MPFFTTTFAGRTFRYFRDQAAAAAAAAGRPVEETTRGKIWRVETP